MNQVEKKNIGHLEINSQPCVSPTKRRRKKYHPSPTKPRTRYRSRYLREYASRVEKIRKILSDKDNDWNLRCGAMKEISDLYQPSPETLQEHKFCLTLSESQELLIPVLPALQIQLNDGRSLIIKQICETIKILALVLGGTWFDKLGVSLLDGLLRLTANSKTAMSKPAIDCLNIIFSRISPLQLLLTSLLQKISDLKNPAIMVQCLICLKAAISIWSYEELLVYIVSIKKCILSTIIAADSTVRAESRKVFARLASVNLSDTDSNSFTELNKTKMSIFNSFPSNVQRIIRQDYPTLGFGQAEQVKVNKIKPSKPWLKKKRKEKSIKNDGSSKKMKLKVQSKIKNKKVSNFKQFLKKKRKLEKTRESQGENIVVIKTAISS